MQGLSRASIVIFPSATGSEDPRIRRGNRAVSDAQLPSLEWGHGHHFAAIVGRHIANVPGRGESYAKTSRESYYTSVDLGI